MLSAADEQYRLRGDGRAATARRAQLAGEAISACEHAITAPARYRSGFRPQDTLFYLYEYARRHGHGFEAAVGRLSTRLIAGLRHYADQQGTSFQEALAAGLREHARQRLHAEGPFQTGQAHTLQSSPPATASFEPVATNQGVIVSAADAQWLLIRTAARNRDCERHGYPASPRDTDDERVLAEALAVSHGQFPAGILGGLEPQVTERVTQIENGPAAAAELDTSPGAPEPRPTATWTWTATPPGCCTHSARPNR